MWDDGGGVRGTKGSSLESLPRVDGVPFSLVRGDSGRFDSDPVFLSEDMLIFGLKFIHTMIFQSF